MSDVQTWYDEVRKTVYECEYDGDITNDCADCVYSGDYHYDETLGYCVER